MTIRRLSSRRAVDGARRARGSVSVEAASGASSPGVAVTSTLTASAPIRSIVGDAPDRRRVKGAIHWVSAAHAVDAEVRLYDHLFSRENPGDESEGVEFTAHLNPNSLEVLTGCKLEPGMLGAAPGSRYQFERLGYFCVDPDSTGGQLVFNRTVALRDTWAKIEKGQQKTR